MARWKDLLKGIANFHVLFTFPGTPWAETRGWILASLACIFSPAVHTVHTLLRLLVTGTCSVTSVVSSSLQPHGLQPARLLCLRYSPGKNTGAGCHARLQGIFPTQGSNPCLLCLLHCRQTFFFFFFFTAEAPGKPSQSPRLGLKWAVYLSAVSFFKELF